ncbi:MAG: hypothetical protein RL721_283 [Candidatus Eisenbacteria bacterium]
MAAVGVTPSASTINGSTSAVSFDSSANAVATTNPTTAPASPRSRRRRANRRAANVPSATNASVRPAIQATASDSAGAVA